MFGFKKYKYYYLCIEYLDNNGIPVKQGCVYKTSEGMFIVKKVEDDMKKIFSISGGVFISFFHPLTKKRIWSKPQTLII